MNRKMKIAVVSLLACFVIGIWAGPIRGSKLSDLFDTDKTVGKVLTGAALVVLTNALSNQLNDFINTVTLNKGVPTEADTKVVPIIAVGSGTRVGAAQVTGPKELVGKVKIVVQIETKFTAKNLDVEVFVPSDSINPLDFNRVEGVGISALIDLRLSGL
ncbi:MAG TPA: hypothetical protein PLN69_07360 [bacterium]|nr:hypothetical protein [bacterium]